MTLHVAVLGIDGSGKSTVSRGLPLHLARERGLVTGHAGETFEVFVPQPGGHVAERRDDLPLSAPIATWTKRVAKSLVDVKWMYPPVKLTQMAFQDSAAWRMGRRHGCALVASDGNLLLNAAGRGGNYRRPASSGKDDERERPMPDDVAAMFRYLVDDVPLPDVARRRLPKLGAASLLLRILRAARLRPAWLPDQVVFLDVDPERALERIRKRAARIDAHENAADMAQARAAYLRALDAFERVRGAGSVHRLDVGSLDPAQAIVAAAGSVAGALPPR